MAEVQAVFLEKMFLWGFIVAWGNSEKMGDKEFLKVQWKTMVSFDEKHEVVATVVRSGALALGGAGLLTLGGAAARTSRGGSSPAYVTAPTPHRTLAPNPTLAPKSKLAPALTHANGQKMIVKPVEPLPKPLAMHVAPEASGSKPPVHRPQPMLPVITVMGPRPVVQSNSNEFEPDEEGEDEMKSDADAEPPRKQKQEDARRERHEEHHGMEVTM